MGNGVAAATLFTATGAQGDDSTEGQGHFLGSRGGTAARRAGLLAGGLSPKRAGKALPVLSQVLGSAAEGGRRRCTSWTLSRSSGSLRVGRLDLLRCTAQVVEAAVEVGRLEWVR
jgi:hypothetical protein